MINETQVLEVVKSVTPAGAYFFDGTLFVETEDPKEAVEIFLAIAENVTPAVAFGKAGQGETYFDFV